MNFRTDRSRPVSTDCKKSYLYAKDSEKTHSYDFPFYTNHFKSIKKIPRSISSQISKLIALPFGLMKSSDSVSKEKVE